MKKWFAVLCFSIVGGVAFAQTDPHAGLQETFLKQISNSEETTRYFVTTQNDPHALGLAAAVERQVVQAQAAQPQTSWPNEDGHQDAVATVSSDRPSYYADEKAYQICKGIDICNTWAQEQAKKEVHFQVLSAQLSMLPDAHNQRLEVSYLMNVNKEIQVFEEYFGNWTKVTK